MKTSETIKAMCNAKNIIAFKQIDKREFEGLMTNPYHTLPYEITNPMLRDLSFCEAYQSDMLVNIENIRENIKRLLANLETTTMLVTGIRKHGVDGNSQFDNNVQNWYSFNNYGMMSAYYRRIYIVEFMIIDDDFKYKNEILGDTKLEYYKGDLCILLHDATNDIPYTNQDKE
jgi:hypothetical protein